MARLQVRVAQNGVRVAETLGTSSAGAVVLEVDLAKILTLGQLRQCVAAALVQMESNIPE